MKFLVQFISVALVIALADSAYYCDVFGSVSQGGIGCEIEEEAISDGETEIVLSHYNPPQTANDIVWIEINFCNFSSSPKTIFETFENLTRVEINNSTGLTNLSTSFFLHRFEEIYIVGNDIQNVGAHAFEGLSSLKILQMNKNLIKTIHGEAFKDLVGLKYLNLCCNQIEALEPETFAANLNLIELRLAHNKLKSIDAQLISKNVQLNILDLHANEISEIGRNFTNGLDNLEAINLKENVCIDDIIQPVTGLELLLEKCYKN